MRADQIINTRYDDDVSWRRRWIAVFTFASWFVSTNNIFYDFCLRNVCGFLSLTTAGQWIYLRLNFLKGKKGKGAYSSLWIGNPSQSYGASPAIWDHTVLPATRHRWTRLALTPAMDAGTRFTYPGGMEGWVDLGVGYITRWFTCPQTVTHPGSNHLTTIRPGVEPTTSRSQVQRPNRYTTKPPSLLGQIEVQWSTLWVSKVI